MLLTVECDPAIDLKFQHRAGGIKEFVDSEKLLTNGPQPKTPYFIWTHDGKRARGIDSGRTHNRNDYYSTLIWVQGDPELASHHLNDFTPGLSLLSRGKLEAESPPQNNLQRCGF